MIAKLCVAALICIGLSACESPEEAKRVSSIGLDRIDDRERGVVCYVYRGFSVSCVKE
jgi:hypothetical protein